MISRWQAWKATQKAKILITLFWAAAIAVLVPFLAKWWTGDHGLTFLSIELNPKGDLALTASPWIAAVLILWILVGYIILWPKDPRWEASEVNIEVAKIGKIVMRPNQEVAGLAHRAWSEIITRKVGLKFDEDHDVIAEIYDSWYQLFAEIRSLIKAVPVEKLRTSEDARALVDALLKLLNDVIRPHLTQHQARFRSWWKDNEDKLSGKAPQDLQKEYPNYLQLTKSLKETNAICVELATALQRIAQGKE